MSHTGNTAYRRSKKTQGPGKTLNKRAVWYERRDGNKVVSVAPPDNKRRKGFTTKEQT